MSSPSTSADLLTIVASTNRPGAASTALAETYLKLATQAGYKAQLLRMDALPADFTTACWEGGSPDFDALVEQYIVRAQRLVFVVPEYNGSYPGILKAFVDASPQSAFYFKKAGIIGVSSGRAGNLRGADQLTNVLNYLRISVFYRKPKLSGVEDTMVQSDTWPQAWGEELTDHLHGVMAF